MGLFVKNIEYLLHVTLQHSRNFFTMSTMVILHELDSIIASVFKIYRDYEKSTVGNSIWGAHTSIEPLVGHSHDDRMNGYIIYIYVIPHVGPQVTIATAKYSCHEACLDTTPVM